MNGIENQENSDSGFYYSLSSNFQADSLFGLPSELFFGETPPSSLSPDAAQRISPQSTEESNLDDGLRTPEPQSFPSDDYSDNGEILNHHLVSDENPSLQVATHVTSDLPAIDSDLIESQCNGTEIGKSYSPRPKDMDITFYSNLECIPEIPGISPLKSLDNNPMKSLEELFEDNKDVGNISNAVSSEPSLQLSCQVVNYPKILNQDASRPTDLKVSNSFGNFPVAVSSVEAIRHTGSESLKVQCSYAQATEAIAEQNNTADNEEHVVKFPAEETKNTSDNTSSNNSTLEMKDTLPSDSLSPTVVQEAAESADAISAAELAICQMLDAITEPPGQNVNSSNNDTSVIPQTAECHVSPLVGDQFHHLEASSESNVSTTPKHICEEEDYRLCDDSSVSLVTSNLTAMKNEKMEYSPPAEENRTVSSSSIIGVTTDECYVYLERLDEDCIRRWGIAAKTSRGGSPKKQKLNHHSAKNICRNTTKTSSHSLLRRRSRCSRSSKKLKVNYYPTDFTSEPPATTLSNHSSPRRRYRCSVCKRVYRSLESLEVHKCKTRKAATFVSSNIPRTAYLLSSLCNDTMVKIESEHCKHREQYFVQEDIPSDQRNSTYKIDQSHMPVPEIKDMLPNEQSDKEEPPFSCQKCSQVFRDQELLIQHLCYMHSTQFTKCDVCKLKFDRNIIIRNHMILHANHKAYCCQLCSFASSFQEGLERHLWAHHSPQDARESITDSEVLAQLKPCSVVLEALPISERCSQWH